MNVPARLGLYAGGLALVFGASFGVAALLAPGTASSATEAAPGATAEAHGGGDDHSATGGGAAGDDHGASGGHGTSGTSTATAVKGVTASEEGYTLTAVDAPDAVGESGTLSFAITGPDGAPLTDYEIEHEKELHLIVVRTDGAEFRHVHPTLDDDGTWSLPWTWDAAGGYRVYADFVPADLGEGLTLTSSLLVGGEVDTDGATPAPATTVTTGPYEVELSGALTAGAESSVQFSVTRDGEPVALEPYLGANGHLVALRDGDLAYLHVHPEHGEPSGDDAHDETDAHTADGGHAASSVSFLTEVPTAGTYLFYMDFQVDGVVHTAAFQVEAS